MEVALDVEQIHAAWITESEKFAIQPTPIHAPETTGDYSNSVEEDKDPAQEHASTLISTSALTDDSVQSKEK